MSITPLPPRPMTLPALARPVPLSLSLADHARGEMHFGGGAFTPEQRDIHPHLVPHRSPPVGSPTQADIAEAVRKLVEAEYVCQPASARVIGAWCLRIVDLPFHPTDERVSKASIAAIGLACADLPAAVWTVETAALALRTFKRWPGPAEVYALLSEQAQPFLRIRAGLRRVVEAGVSRPAPPRSGPSEEVASQVAAVVRAFVAERTFNDPERVTDPAVAACKRLSSGALLGVWEKAARDGLPGAAARVAMLRSQVNQT